MLEFEPLLDSVSRQARTLFLRSLESRTNSGVQKLPERPDEALAANIFEPSWIARDAKQTFIDQQVRKHERARNFIKRLQAPVGRERGPVCPPLDFPISSFYPPQIDSGRQWFVFQCWDSHFRWSLTNRISRRYVLSSFSPLPICSFLPSTPCRYSSYVVMSKPLAMASEVGQQSALFSSLLLLYTWAQLARTRNCLSMDSLAISYLSIVLWT